MKKKIVIFSGAGMSQESGLQTFRGVGGIWESIDQENPDIRIDDKAPDGSQIRPDVIFFNENLQYGIWKSAVQAIREADMMIIVGCSLKVSPAAEMVEELREETLFEQTKLE